MDIKDPHARNRWGQGWLHLRNDVRSVKAYIEAGTDVNTRDKNGNTPLHMAVMAFQDNSDAVQLIIEAGADVNARNEKGETPLHLSIVTPATQALIKAGADVNARDELGQTADETAKDNDKRSLIVGERLARQEARSKAAGASIEAAFEELTPAKVKSLGAELRAMAERATSTPTTPLKSRGLEL